MLCSLIFSITRIHLLLFLAIWSLHFISYAHNPRVLEVIWRIWWPLNTNLVTGSQHVEPTPAATAEESISTNKNTQLQQKERFWKVNTAVEPEEQQNDGKTRAEN